MHTLPLVHQHKHSTDSKNPLTPKNTASETIRNFYRLSKIKLNNALKKGVLCNQPEVSSRSKLEHKVTIHSIDIDRSPEAFPLTTITINHPEFYRDLIKSMTDIRNTEENFPQVFGPVTIRNALYLIPSCHPISKSLLEMTLSLSQGLFKNSNYLKLNTATYGDNIAIFQDSKHSYMNASPHIDRYAPLLLKQCDSTQQQCRSKAITALIRFDELPEDQQSNGTVFFNSAHIKSGQQVPFSQEFIQSIQQQDRHIESPKQQNISITFFDSYFQWHEIETPSAWQENNNSWYRYGIQMFLFNPIEPTTPGDWEYQPHDEDDHNNHPILGGFEKLKCIKFNNKIDPEELAKIVDHYAQEVHQIRQLN